MKKLLFVAASLLSLIMFSCKENNPVGNPELLADVQSLNFPSEGNSLEIKITSNVSFAVQESCEWIEVSPADGSGNATITVTAMKNTENESRTAIISIVSEEIKSPVIVNVTQDAFEVESCFEVTPNESIEAEYTGRNCTFVVKSSEAWVLSLETWMVADMNSGNGDAEVDVQISANETAEARSGKIVFSQTESGQKIIIDVTQKMKEKIESVTDVEGNTYKVIEVGGTYWMSENLKSGKFNDGEEIPVIIYQENYIDLWENTEWYKNADKPAMSYYKGIEANKELYGMLYNWKAASDDRICPEGWTIPTKDDWAKLADAAGGKDVAGKALKATEGWENGNGTDELGFKGVPGGNISGYGGHFYGGVQGYWWTSTDIGDGYIFLANLVAHKDQIYIEYKDLSKEGLSIRCIRKQ